MDSEETKNKENTKSNFQKMIDQKLYDASDIELADLRKQIRIKMKKYNNTTEDEEELRVELLHSMFGGIEGSVKIEPPFYCDYGKNIYIGKNFYMNFDCTILDCAKVIIGDNVMCGPKVQILTPGHPVDPVERLKGLEFAKTVRIGSNVWLGAGVIVCPGVTIGDNTTIGAGSVVTKDIPANVVAAGVPCKVIKLL